ncbi:hypothetical protein DAI22_02g023900 [Oryza sativa Japonica Group]|nr:hypothetical protein DAI22_02g023900 [Oryza sativa Japonica Group]
MQASACVDLVSHGRQQEPVSCRNMRSSVAAERSHCMVCALTCSQIPSGGAIFTGGAAAKSWSS